MDKFEEAFLAGFEDGLEKVAKKVPVGLLSKIKGGAKRYGQLMAGGKEMGAKGRPGNVPWKYGKMGKKQQAEVKKSIGARGATAGGVGLTAMLAGAGGDSKKKDK